jgi:ABC-type multidrug transport system fused ATPase/permease subunit
MLQTFAKFLDLMTPHERRRFYLLLVVIVVMGIVEMVSVASVLPFLAVLSNPEVIETNRHLAMVYHGLGFTDHRSFLVFLGIAVFLLVVAGLLFSTVTQYAIYRFTFMRGYSISIRMLRGYLFQPYTWFLHRHSAELGTAVLSEVNQVIGQAMVPAMKLLAAAAVAVFVIGLLVLVRPAAALVAALVLGGSYSLIYLGVRRTLTRIGRQRYLANQERFRIAGEAMGGIKEIKVIGLEATYLRRFQDPARRMASVVAVSSVIGELPRNILKAIGYGALLFFVLFLLLTGDGSLGSVLPVLGLYAFAGIRLFPAFQQIYGSMTMMRFSRPILDKLAADMAHNRATAEPPDRSSAAATPLRLTGRLELVDVHYSYPKAERAALEGLDLAIEANTTVGIVGGTGAGKTTTVDVILGLLVPQAGELRVDGVPVIAANRRAWQNSIGYVPQAIFLTDDSVAANIAFGLPPEEIDHAAVERAARIAELHDFVTDELPDGYATRVGERGVRLSGGQRQRIGIARALYHDPDVLILDEATSALDNLTEKAVMDAVHNLGHAKTIVLIAHRLSTVRDCDTIFMLERGRVIAQGRYDALLETSQKFRAMAAGAA